MGAPERHGQVVAPREAKILRRHRVAFVRVVHVPSVTLRIAGVRHWAVNANPSDVLHQILGGTWQLLGRRDNDVYTDATRLVKVARHEDGARRLAVGLHAAREFAAAGVPVVAPLRDKLLDTPLGAASLWPLVEHVHATGPALGEDYARALGRALVALSGAPPFPPTPWDPFARVPARLSGSEFSPALTGRIGELVNDLAPLATEVSRLETTFAHGDASIANTLCLTDGRVKLIDLDSAGWRPRGWDLACLYVHLDLEAGNRAAFAALAREFSPSERRHVPRLALVKAAMATTFALTLEPTERRTQLLEHRVTQLHVWAGSRAPTALAPID